MILLDYPFVSDFQLEEYIRGEEYAFDCYFDKNGDPVILNILHHVFISEKDVSDRWYYSSEEVINQLHDPLNLEYLGLCLPKQAKRMKRN
ncbi:ATP-grasp domain-containing protein [Belliella baltica]|uniref:ATP-grasp domain-containing protein n=1 Tax=Belliella baltica TaxID=232259 RepID=UPI0003096670|nr:ATP-grasp domain-containing protein [Belliella baltica]